MFLTAYKLVKSIVSIEVEFDCHLLTVPVPAPYVQGVDGVMNAYHSALGQWGLSGPTNFAPSLSAAMNMASRHQSEESNTYTIMLIITDGLITDMQATINALVSASVLPISVLIVGVGDADFSGMEALDGDDQGLVRGTLWPSATTTHQLQRQRQRQHQQQLRQRHQQ